MVHMQKADFVFRRKGRVHLNRRGRQFSRLLAAELCASAVVMLDNTMFRGSVKGTGYPLHSPVSLSLPLPCVTVCHHISTGVYLLLLAGQKDKWAEPGNLRTGAYFQFSFFFINGSSDLLFIRDTEFNLTRWAARICVP